MYVVLSYVRTKRRKAGIEINGIIRLCVEE